MQTGDLPDLEVQSTFITLTKRLVFPRRDQDDWTCLIPNTAECILPTNSIPNLREAPELLTPSVVLSGLPTLRPHLAADLVVPSFNC